LNTLVVFALTMSSAAAISVAAAQVPVQIPGPPSTSTRTDPLTGTTWQWLRSEYGNDSVVAAANPARYTVVFQSDGTLAVRADCNQVSGIYVRSEASLSLQLGPSTLAACPTDSQADVFVRDLSVVDTYVFSGDNLVLNLRADGSTMTFEAQPVLALAGSTWDVLSYNNGRAAVITTLPETHLTTTFAADGRIGGDAGCNTFEGAYTVAGNSLSIGPLATTRMACAQPIMQQEQAFLTALQAASKYMLTSDRLTLRDPNGAIQVALIPPG
jgi:heat shock protein HslJ